VPRPPLTTDPNKMPGTYWAFGFYVLMGLFVLPFIFAMVAGDVRWLMALASLPHAQSLDPGAAPDGAVFRGRLAGEAHRTPLGAEAAAWAGVVQVRGSGRSGVVREKCRLVAFDGLTLETQAGRAKIAVPKVYTLDAHVSLGGSDRVARWWLSDAREVSPVPPDSATRCNLDQSAFADEHWSYIEYRASVGAPVEIAGCLSDGTISGCESGPAVGHLAVGGMAALIQRLADNTTITISLLTVLMCFFTIVSGVGAVMALRRAAIGSGGVL
jgi:hypothetical protein